MRFWLLFMRPAGGGEPWRKRQRRLRSPRLRRNRR